MDTYYCKKGEKFQTDKIICSGKDFNWSPKFAYHGFRYIEVSGIRDIESVDVKGIFVHQDIERRTTFEDERKRYLKTYSNRENRRKLRIRSNSL